MEIKDKNIEIKGKGIKIHALSSIFIAIGLLIMVASIFAVKNIYDKYDKTREDYQNTGRKLDASISFRNASDYLTEQSRTYVVTGDIQNAINYFEEKDIARSREASIDMVGTGEGLEIEKSLLSDAMENSEELVDYELHAMKLMAEAKGEDCTKISEELSAYQLPENEKALSADEKRNQAIELLFGKDYENRKERIDWDVENSTILIEDESGANFRENEDDLIVILNITTMLIFSLFILLVLIFIFNVLLVVKPSDKFIKALDEKEKLPEIGSYEFRKFARRYNNVYRSDKKNKELLKEQGEIDELTGTLKVGTLDLVRHNLSQHKEPLGIMLVDIDNFRSIKESKGYDIADNVVKKVANLFLTSFKSSDYIIRTSQDEFELFLLRMQKSDEEMLVERINKINESLKEATDDVPAVSVSVGVTFAEDGYDKEAERKADMALNYVKENGRGYCKVN
ncbi:MAG: GGDEF domain-containing protein [Lachnospiraceae bacterium]|nr:GGDEF domain-containing protein [Lachnospiraceae bacterium]